MKTLLLLILTTLCAQAQSRYVLYQLGDVNSNAVFYASTATNLNSSASVGPTKTADILFSYNLTTNAPSGTNPVTLLFAKSIDGTYYTNFFTFSVTAATNATVWNQTNISVADCQWLRLVNVTNSNGWIVTNPVIYVGYKQGL